MKKTITKAILKIEIFGLTNKIKEIKIYIIIILHD